NTALLALQLRKRIGKLGLKKMIFSGIKSSVAAAATGASAWGVCEFVHGHLFISVPAAIVIGVAVFFVVSKILKSEELDIFLQTYYRKKESKV
ncbi:MAG: hypothetical protein FWD71_23290, partial [Oscillospiraceae bacterium]|nr:hypothetical protein [Oscillospiraceae bacterium]